MKKSIILIIICLMLAGCDKKNAPVDIDFEHKVSSPAADIEPALSKEAEKYVQFQKPAENDIIAEIVVEGYGIIRAKLFDKLAPVTAANFIRLAEEGYYDNTLFYRVFEDYMAQVYIDTSSIDGQDIYLPDELNQSLHPFRGALCAANMEAPDTNTSSFFIIQTGASVIEEITYLLNEGKKMTLKEYISKYYYVELSDQLIDGYKFFGGAPWLTGRHTVFGQVYEGFEVLDKIAGAAADEAGAPYDDIRISCISIIY